MTKKTRYFLFGSVTVLLVGLCTGLVAYYTGMPMGAFSRAQGPAELRYVPADATLVAYADVQDVMRSEFRQKLRAVMGHDEDGKQEFQKETGIDIEHDIDHVIAFSEPGSLQGKSYAGMVIASGRFDVAQARGARARARRQGRGLQGQAPADRQPARTTTARRTR